MKKIPKYMIDKKSGRMVAVPDIAKEEDKTSDKFDALIKETQKEETPIDEEEFQKLGENLETYSQPQQQEQPVMQQQPYRQPQNPQPVNPLYMQQQALIMQQQNQAYQEAMLRQQQMLDQQKMQQPRPVTIIIRIIEGEKITVPLDSNSADEFMEQLNMAMAEGAAFKIDLITINTKNIILYSVEYN